MNEAIRDWIANVEDTHYLIGSAAGPHPYPLLVRELQAVISREARAQLLEREDRLPDAVIACVGGGSNAIGAFHAFRDDPVRLIGVEAGGDGGERHAASIGGGKVSVLHGSRSYVLCDEHGQVVESHSISAGLDYPGVGPEHAFLAETGRAEYVPVPDAAARRELPPPVPARGHHPRARVVARALDRRDRRARARPRRHRPRLPLRPRRQGRRHDHRARTVKIAHAGARDLPDGRRGTARARSRSRTRRRDRRSRSASRSRTRSPTARRSRRPGRPPWMPA